MRKKISVFSICLALLILLISIPAAAKTEEVLKKIQWLGQSSLRINTGKLVIYCDPWELGDSMSADLILITHSHHDHLSLPDLAKLVKDTTIIVTNAETASHLPSDYQVKIIKAGETLTVQGISIAAVPAYNNTLAYHPNANGWTGFILSLDGIRIYDAGDTDFIEEMKTIKADIAFLPIGGKYTMGPEEAARAAAALNPQVLIPFHYGKVVGSDADVEVLKNNYSGHIEVLPLGK